MWLWLYIVLHGHPMPLLPQVFEDIAMEPYEWGVNDCSNKARHYADACIAKGIPAEVIFVRPNGSKELHCIVFVAGLYCDPTSGKVKKTLAEFGEKVTSVSAYHLKNDEEFA